MNFKFKRENETLTIEVNLDPRTRLDKPRVRLGMPDIINIINDNFSFGDEEKLGECLSPKYGIDNVYHDRCHGSWTFKLLSTKKPVRKQISKPKPLPRTSKRKTVTKKSLK
mgnify:FL=1